MDDQHYDLSKHIHKHPTAQKAAVSSAEKGKKPGDPTDNIPGYQFGGPLGTDDNNGSAAETWTAYHNAEPNLRKALDGANSDAQSSVAKGNDAEQAKRAKLTELSQSQQATPEGQAILKKYRNAQAKNRKPKKGK